MRAVVVVQARLSSSRLPGKAMLAISGRPMIEHVLGRAQQADIGPVILATSDNPRDEVLAVTAIRMGIPVLSAGPEWDVLGRFSRAVDGLAVDAVVRLTGDCPLLAPEVVRRVAEDFALGGADYVSNDTTCSGYPDGTDVEIFSAHALALAAESATDRADREHVTPWMRRCLVTRTVVYPGLCPVRKLSVDSPEDLAWVRRVAGYVARGEYGLEATLAASLLAARDMFGS